MDYEQVFGNVWYEAQIVKGTINHIIGVNIGPFSAYCKKIGEDNGR